MTFVHVCKTKWSGSFPWQVRTSRSVNPLREKKRGRYVNFYFGCFSGDRVQLLFSWLYCHGIENVLHTFICAPPSAMRLSEVQTTTLETNSPV